MKCELCSVIDEKYRIVRETNYSLAFVNIEPLLEGHLTIIPKEHRENYKDLTESEVKDMMSLVEDISLLLRNKYKTEAALTTINHGINQSQKHVHLHIIPTGKDQGVRDIISSFFKVPFRVRINAEELENIKNKISE